MLVSAAPPKPPDYHVTFIQKGKFAMAGAPSPAREARALPRISNRFESCHDAIFRMIMLLSAVNEN